MNDDQNIKFSKGGVEPEETLKEDDGISPVKAVPKTNDAGDTDSTDSDLEDVGPGRIYDFSDDMNILPVKDEEGAFDPVAATATDKPKAQAPQIPPVPKQSLNNQPVPAVTPSIPKPPTIETQIPPIQNSPVPLVPSVSQFQTKPIPAEIPKPTEPLTAPTPQVQSAPQLKIEVKPQAEPLPQSKPFPPEPFKQQSGQFPAAIIPSQSAPKPYTLDLDQEKTAKPVISQPAQPLQTAATPFPIPNQPIQQTPPKPPATTPVPLAPVFTPPSINNARPSTPSVPPISNNVPPAQIFNPDVRLREPLSQIPKPPSTPNQTTNAQVPVLPITPGQSPYTIPMQSVRAPIQKGKLVPANPQAKKIDFGTTGSDDEIVDKGNLQDTVKGMMSPDGKIPGSDQKNPNLKPLRTYEGDVADVLSKRNVSTATIAIAESKKDNKEERIVEQVQEKQPLPKNESHHIFLKALITIISLCLIGGGLYGAYYLYSQSILAPSPQTSVPQQTTMVSSLVPADTQAVLPVHDIDPSAIASEISTEVSKSQSPDTIKNIVLTQDINGQVTPVDGPGMLTLSQLTPPNEFIRSLTSPWMLGVYADPNGQKSVFVVATTNYFQGAFAGMLAWENVMPDDLRQFLFPSQVLGVANAPAASTILRVTTASSTVSQTGSTTATSSLGMNTSSTTKRASHASTPSTTKVIASSSLLASTTSPTVSTATVAEETVQPYTTIRGQFSDHVILNKDVREFRTTDGTLVFLYSFINNNELVFTTSEAALSEIITRLEKQ